MRVVVTGSTGYAGGYLARALASDGHAVIAPVRDVSSAPDEAGIEPLECDLTGDLAELPATYDAVVHAAAHAPPRADSPKMHTLHNICATHNLIRHAQQRRGRRFVLLSSISVYGVVTEPRLDERTPVRDPGSYGVSKRMCELLLEEQAERLTGIALRLPGLLGPRAPNNGVWLARVREAIANGAPFAIYSAESPFNNAVHLADLAGFVKRWLAFDDATGFEVLALACRDPAPLREVVHVLADALNAKARPVTQQGSRATFIIGIERAMAEHGFCPMSVLDAVRRFASDEQLPTDATT